MPYYQPKKDEYKGFHTLKQTSKRTANFEVFFVRYPIDFHTQGDDGSRVDMLSQPFKAGWYWWPRHKGRSDPSDDPLGPFTSSRAAYRNAALWPFW
jgi:hypothetical protein